MFWSLLFTSFHWQLFKLNWKVYRFVSRHAWAWETKRLVERHILKTSND